MGCSICVVGIPVPFIAAWLSVPRFFYCTYSKLFFMKAKAITILRWIGILPCAVAAYLIVYYIVYYVQRFYSDANSWNMVYVTPIIASMGGGLAFMVYGVKVTPFHRNAVALILFVLILLIDGAAMFLSLHNKEYLEIISVVASVIGSIIGYILCKDEELIKTL